MAAPPAHDLSKRRVENALSAFSPKRRRQGVPRSESPRDAQANVEAGAGSIDTFRPWSRDDLLARIATYKIHTWLVQSPELSPVRCARNGWINSDCSTLKCLQCSAILIAQIPDDLTDDEEVRWIGRLAQQLQSSHAAKCPWRDRVCSGTLYSVPLATSQEVVDEICRCAADILGLSGKLPVTQQPLSTLQHGLLRELRSKVIRIHGGGSVSETPPPADEEIGTALVLALFGWRCDSSRSQAVVKCELCFRSAGLWMFQGAGKAKAAVDTDAGEQLQPFDVVDEHRGFCYWVCGADMDASHKDKPSAEAIPGWKKTMASVLRAKAIGRDSDSESNADNGAGSDAAELKPFNISAISSAAEAFGIPFSMSLLKRATMELASMGGSQAPTAKPAETAASSSASSKRESLAIPQGGTAATATEGPAVASGADWGADGALPRLGEDEDEIPAPIDTSGLSDLLGGSTLASALEDPDTASAILEYVKGLLKAKNAAPT
ncbi:hypothetical protein GGF46_003158 [Coemansia sp. RSA 552]|nr:hypothetical protein GGF46_003158 [Coemansia sp. RSA 552]